MCRLASVYCRYVMGHSCVYVCWQTSPLQPLSSLLIASTLEQSSVASATWSLFSCTMQSRSLVVGTSPTTVLLHTRNARYASLFNAFFLCFQHTVTLRWAVLTVLWFGFCHTWPISLCVDLFVFVCICVFYFILLSCCISVSTLGWTWWDWSLILRTYLPSVLWHCWFRHLTLRNPSPIWPIMCLVGH